MSYYIKIHSWAGQNPENTVARFAKVFHFPIAQATGIMQGIQKGQAWQFDKTISSLQSDKARAYLQSLGYNVELLPVIAPPPPSAPVTAKRAPSERLSAPMSAPQRKSPLDFLKKFKLGGITGDDKKSTPSRQTDADNTKSPKKSFLDFLIKGKTAETTMISSAAKSSDAQIAPLPKKSFLDFLKKKNTDAAPEQKKPEPMAYRRKSNIAPIFFVVALVAAALLMPYILGMRAEVILNELMPRMFQKGVELKVKSYDRGWLRSSAEYTISAPTGLIFQAVSEIEHGPFSLEELLSGNIHYFQARIESKIPVNPPKASDGNQAPDPLENLVMKGYFVKKGKLYKMDLLVLDEGLNVNGKLIPNTQK